MSEKALWFVGSDGKWSADMGGVRYCVDLIDRRNKESGYKVLRDGIEITGPQMVGAPAGHRTVEAAKSYAERHGGAS